MMTLIKLKLFSVWSTYNENNFALHFSRIPLKVTEYGWVLYDEKVFGYNTWRGTVATKTARYFGYLCLPLPVTSSRVLF